MLQFNKQSLEKKKQKEKEHMLSYWLAFKDNGRWLPGETDGTVAVQRLRGHGRNADRSSGLKNKTCHKTWAIG